MEEDIFRGLGAEVELDDMDLDGSFLKIKETLTRIGIASKRDKTLYQTCHILHKRGRYAILHFKELFLLDGKSDQTNLTQEDVARRNTIVSLLDEWELANPIGQVSANEEDYAPMKSIKVVPYREKDQWNLVAKYTIGKKRED